MGIGGLAFVGGLFMMALACLVIAGTSSSLGWFVGGIIFLSVAIYAMRQWKREEETERQGVSIGFFGGAILFMAIAMAGIIWLGA